MATINFESYFKNATDFYHIQLLREENLSRVHDVLAQYEITEETLNKYSIGFASAHWTKLTSVCKTLDPTQSLTFEEIERTGLISFGKRKYYDSFRNRLIFPASNEAGEIVGLIGEDVLGALPDHLRYQYSKNYARNYKRIFHREENVFGLAQALQAIKQHNSVFLVENYLEVLRLDSLGVCNVLSTGNRPFNVKLARLLASHCQRVIIAFPAESVLRKVADFMTDILLSTALNVYVHTSYNPYQSIDMVNEQLFHEVIPFRIHALQELREADKRENAIISILRSICFIPIANDRRSYIQQLSVDTGIPVSFLNDRAEKFLNNFAEKTAKQQSRKR